MASLLASAAWAPAAPPARHGRWWRRAPSALLSFGLAGGLDPALRCGAVVLPRRGAARARCTARRTAALRPAPAGVQRLASAAAAAGRAAWSRRQRCSPARSRWPRRRRKSQAVRATPARSPSIWRALPWPRSPRSTGCRSWCCAWCVDTAADALPASVAARVRSGGGALRWSRAWLLLVALLPAPTDLAALLRLAGATGARSARCALRALRGSARRIDLRASAMTGAGHRRHGLRRRRGGARAAGRRLAGARAGARAAPIAAISQGLPLELVIGDLRDPLRSSAALHGCEALFHVAADYRLWAPRPAGALPHATSRARATCSRPPQRAGVRAHRLHQQRRHARPARPMARRPMRPTWPPLADMIGHYKRSKFLAEQWVRRGGGARIAGRDRQSLDAVGPGDIKPTPTGQHRARRRRRPHAGLRGHRAEHRACR